MVDTLNNLYSLSLHFLGVCIILLILTLGYIIGILKYFKKYMALNEELVEIKINNIINKENI